MHIRTKNKQSTNSKQTGVCNEIKNDSESGRKPTKNYIVAQIGPKRKFYNILIDSGAGASCISEKLVKRDGLRLLDLAKDDHRVLNSANNTKFKVLGKVITNFAVDNVDIAVVTFYVVESLSSSIILGYDMLRYVLNAKVDLPRDELRILDDSLVIPLTHATRQCSVAYLKAEKEIPPGTEMLVRFRVARHFKDDSKTVYVT